jgi:hypothetical protein
MSIGSFVPMALPVYQKRLVLSVAIKFPEKLAGTLASTCGVDETIACPETR